MVVLTYLRGDFWQWIDRIDPPTSSHSVFRPNPLEQRQKQRKWWIGMKIDLKKVEAFFVRQHLPAKTNSFPFRFISLTLSAYLHICANGWQKNHQKSKKETEDTIFKKMFLRVLMHICVSVYFLKKSQPERQKDCVIRVNSMGACRNLSFNFFYLF